MKIKHIFTGICLIASTATSGYFAYNFGKESAPQQVNNSSEIKELQSEVDRLQLEVKSKKLSPRDQYVLNAINKYGINNVIALALNGRYECPSAKEQKVDRCDTREELTIMYSTINFSKSEKMNIEQAVYHKNKDGTYIYSWVPSHIGNKDITSPIFKHSLELAFQVLGGNPTLEQYDYGQQFYCRESKSPTACSWHKTSSNLSYLGRINLSNQEIRQHFIRENELSYHTFWGRK
jgi:hypothetical protein